MLLHYYIITSSYMTIYFINFYRYTDVCNTETGGAQTY